MADVKGFRSAFFIDTDARRCPAGQRYGHWPANIGRPTFLAKGFLLLATFIGVCILVDLGTPRGFAVAICTATFVLRVIIQMTCFWRRAIPWKEVVFEAGGIIPLSFASLAWGCAQTEGVAGSFESKNVLRFGWDQLFYAAVFFLGTAANFLPELSRHRWKNDAAMREKRIGKLYTGSLFKYARHINYTGEIVSFVGLSLLTGAIWTLWVPLCMGVGMATFSVWEIEYYLAQRYCSEWQAYCRATPWLLVPGLY